MNQPRCVPDAVGGLRAIVDQIFPSALATWSGWNFIAAFFALRTSGDNHHVKEKGGGDLGSGYTYITWSVFLATIDYRPAAMLDLVRGVQVVKSCYFVGIGDVILVVDLRIHKAP